MRFLAALLLTLSVTVQAAPHLATRQELSCNSGSDGSKDSSDGSASSANSTSSNSTIGGVDPSLVPEFGVVQGTNAGAVQADSCEGSNGVSSVLIPCFCPPDRQSFLEKLGAAVLAGNVLGTPITFSNNASDQSVATNQQRATASLIMLQNFNGTKGVGCPAASAPDFLLQQKTGIRNDTLFVGSAA